MFEDSGFEVYETSARSKPDDEEEIETPDRHKLQMKEVLNSIKEKFYELVKHIAEWTVEERDPQMEKWLSWLHKLTGPIRSRGVEEALKEVQNEEIIERKRQRDDDDEADEADEE